MNVKKPKTKNYKSIGEIFLDLSTMLKPPERLTVSQAAEKYRKINQPGAYVGDWLNSTVQYMVEPMDTFTSREFNGMVFVSAAQAAKTDALVINTLAYSVVVDPLDMMVVCPTMLDARDFGIRRIDRLHMHSPAVGAMLLPTADADNRYDKQYRSGMLFTLAWPTESQLAGKPIARVVLTDRDRMVDNVDGIAGEPFDLAMKRTTTFGSYAMTVAESSPSKPITDLKWIPRTLHEAPPCEGILKLYNRGDRRRWYWPCPDCGEFFEGRFKHLIWDTTKESNVDKGATARMVCPVCSYKIHPDERHDMQLQGVWLKDGQSIDRSRNIHGKGLRTQIASFWLNGVAAAFSNWKKIVTTYLDAEDEFERTGSEEALKKFYNNDLGEPYYPRSSQDQRLPEVLKSRAERLGERVVPAGVRFLVGLVDVQKNMFVVQVFGIMPGRPFDTVLIDRYDVRKSKRTDEDGERMWIKPHAYLEDWDELIEHVIEKEYPLDDGSGRMMQMKMVGCDSGGKEGVTTKAYDFYRKLREMNKHRRFILLKGDPLPNHPRTRISYPDASKRDSKSGARGDVPVLFLNSNVLKDDLNGRLDCLEPGKGMFRFSDWFSDSLFSELCGEVRTDKGWVPVNGVRNEAWDLSYYCIGLCVSELLRVEHINWAEPPKWAADWDENDLVHEAHQESRFAAQVKSDFDFAGFAKALA